MTPAARERPVLFSAPMVRAILDGTKTQTRRVVTVANSFVNGGPPVRRGVGLDSWHTLDFNDVFVDRGPSPAGNAGPYLKVAGLDGSRHRVYSKTWIGDRLWVRETFYCDHCDYPNAPREDMVPMLEYRADHDCRDWEAGCPCRDDDGRSSWLPSIHMPRWASRIVLEVTGVRVQRVQAITEEDATAEGCPKSRAAGLAPIRASAVFEELWDSINGARPGKPYGEAKSSMWRSNPWVWVIEFRRVEP